MDKSYVQKIKQWVELDNMIEARKAKMKVHVDEKKELEDDILGYIDQKNLQNVQINIPDGNIKFTETTTTTGITLKSVKEGLNIFFEQSQVNNTPITADAIYAFLLNSRQSKKKLLMKRQRVTVTS
jgi:hypothetical protein